MPGLLTYRTLASASRGNRVTGGHAAVWPKPGKKLEDIFPPLQQYAKEEGLVFPLQMLPSFQPSESQVKQTSTLKMGMDSFPRMMQARMYGDAFNAERSCHSSGSGSEHEPNSVCLAEMVHDFMEDELTQLCKCGRVRCNCDMSKANGADELSDIIDKSKQGHEGEISKTLKGFTSAMGARENALFVDVIKAMAYVKEQEIDIGSEGIEITGACLRRATLKHLIAAGYNAAICKSRWEQAGGFPGGEYEYLDVINIRNSSSERLIIDIQFRAQFEIARPTDEYSALFQELPSVFVGKADRMLQIVNVMSDAIKKSLKKNGMHLPPWRKPDYIKAKWFSSYRRSTRIVGQHLNNRDKVRRQDLGWDSKLVTGKELQYEKIGAVQEVIVNDIDICAKSPLKASKREPESVFKSGNNLFYNGNEITVMLTDWQPPLVNSRLSRKADYKVAGLASALMEAHLSALAKKQNAVNCENFSLTVNRVVTTA